MIDDLSMYVILDPDFKITTPFIIMFVVALVFSVMVGLSTDL